MKSHFNHFAELYRYLEQSSPKNNFLNDRNGVEWKTLPKDLFLQYIRYLTLASFDNNWTGKQVANAVSPSSFWLIIDYALMLSGAVSVPLFTNISSKNLLYQLSDSNIHTVFIENEAQEKLIRQADSSIEVIYVNKVPDGCKTFEDLLSQGKDINKANPTLFDELLGRVKKDDLATIVYTSGTSGDPKGVELTHANLISQIHATTENYFFEKHTDVAFSFLPLAHIFERM
ncbi:MAG TPA: hypothetical protein ENJ71_05530, partial [Epsilonproteobacteria bacterium]|nr:hypothetical protein [Campylobacterota bacterium]